MAHVVWGCRIHRLYLSRLPPISSQDMTLINLMIRFQKYWNFGICGVPLHSHRSEEEAPDRVRSVCQIQLNCVFKLNWIAWNRTVLTFKLSTYAKLNCFKWNCFCMLKWISWNRSVWLNWIALNRNIFDN